MQAILSLKELGFNIWLEAGKIHYKQQADSVDQDKVSSLLAKIKANRDEAIRYLKNEAKTIEEIDITSLNPDFSKANLVVTLHSDLLNEDFFLVSNPELRSKVEAENPGTVAYLPQEIENLAGLGPDKVKKLHYSKKIFGGEFVSRGKASESIFTQTALVDADPTIGQADNSDTKQQISALEH